MKGSILRWTTAIAATAVLAVPAATRAQTPPATAPQPPAASATADTQPVSPAEHIRLAKAAIENIPADSLKGKPKTQVAELKRHLSSLERAAAAPEAKAGAAATAATAGAAKAGPSWATEVAAIDKILTELTGNASPSGAAAATGPTGTAGASKDAAVALDATTSAKLLEVRTHVTAFAAAMSGTAPAANTAAPMAASPDAIAAANPPATSSAAPTATASAQPPATGSPQPPAPQPPTPSTPDPAVAGTTPQNPTPDATVDQEAAAKHLTAARDSLTQLTAMPAAAQLTGDARTQVQQLIANFNELITTKAEWRASYAKVDANLTALLGVERPDESPATPPAATPPAATPATPPTSPPTGTAGAVGTTGTTTASLDPALRAKLMEMRTHLVAFQKAAGGPGL
jgi:hypothetical protein